MFLDFLKHFSVFTMMHLYTKEKTCCSLLSLSSSALQLPPWLPKQRPRFHSAPEHHGIHVIIPAELPVLPPDPPLLRLPVPPEPAEESSPPPRPPPSPYSPISFQGAAPTSWSGPPSVHYIIPTQLTLLFNPPSPLTSLLTAFTVT